MARTFLCRNAIVGICATVETPVGSVTSFSFMYKLLVEGEIATASKVEWLLSDFCEERDESALPIFKNMEKIVFADEWKSREDVQWVAEWNCLNKQLLSITTNIRNDEQAI